MNLSSYFRISSHTVYSSTIKMLTAREVVLLFVVHCDVPYCLPYFIYSCLTTF